jgi:DNA-binding MarR family transcriptional regulator
MELHAMRLARSVCTVREATRSNELLLDEQVCFALYAASRAVTDVYRPLLEGLGLTYPQYLVMLVLWEHGQSSVRGVGAALDLDYGTVSPLLKRLERRGLLTRRRCAADERTVTVALTDAGWTLRERAEPIPAVVGCAVGIDAPERRELIARLRAVTESVRRYNAAQEPNTTE